MIDEFAWFFPTIRWWISRFFFTCAINFCDFLPRLIDVFPDILRIFFLDRLTNFAFFYAIDRRILRFFPWPNEFCVFSRNSLTNLEAFSGFFSFDRLTKFAIFSDGSLMNLMIFFHQRLMNCAIFSFYRLAKLAAVSWNQFVKIAVFSRDSSTNFAFFSNRLKNFVIFFFQRPTDSWISEFF